MLTEMEEPFYTNAEEMRTFRQPRRIPSSDIQDRQSQLQGLKNAIQRVGSLAQNHKSYQVARIPNTMDIYNSCQGVEDYKPRKREEPEHDSPRSKEPFYRNSWFFRSIHIFLLFLITGAIIAIACDRANLIPNRIMKGQIFTDLECGILAVISNSIPEILD